MALVDKDSMTILRTAAEAKTTASTAEVDIQLKAVAYAINTAANTGLTRIEFSEKLLDDVSAKLKANGYAVSNAGQAEDTRPVVISWKGAK